MKKYVWLLSVCFLVGNELFAESLSEKMAKALFVKNVEIVRAHCSEELSLAAYKEVGPTVVVTVGQTSLSEIYYAEVSDVGGTLISVDQNEVVKIIKQAHVLDCPVIQEFFSGNGTVGFRSICDKRSCERRF